jgi:hypothetical protein
MTRRISLAVISVISLILFGNASAQDAGERVLKQGTIQQDLYAAGGEVVIDADVTGDVLVAGGDVAVGKRVRGDVMAAGGQVSLSGEVSDDVRAAGGEVFINLVVGDDLIAAGGSVALDPGTRVGGRTWLSGGTVDVAGTLGRELRAAGGDITVTATVAGNAEIYGDSIHLRSGTVIDGDLVYYSTRAARIDDGAVVRGTVTHKQVDEYRHGAGAARAGGGLLFLVMLWVAVATLVWLFPQYTRQAARQLGAAPLKSLGLGFALLVATPVAAVLLMVLTITLLPGLALLALYLVALLTGFLVALVFVARRGAELMKQDIDGSRLRLVLMLAGAVVVFGVVQLIPLLGGLAWFFALLFGLGGGMLELAARYRATGAS